MRDAFEEDEKYYPSDAVRDAYILGAAQYILFKGQDLVQRIACPGLCPTRTSGIGLPGRGTRGLRVSTWPDGAIGRMASGPRLRVRWRRMRSRALWARRLR